MIKTFMLVLGLTTAAHGAGLTGEARVAFVGEAFASCVNTTRGLAYMETVKYCDCTATAIADRASPDVLKGTERLPAIKEIADVCWRALKK